MDWTARVRAAFQTHTIDADVVAELADHARALYDAGRADGLSHDEADDRVNEQLARWRAEAPFLRRKPRVPFAPAPPAPAASRFAGLLVDFRYAIRLLHRQRRHSLLVIGTMMLGIAATTVLFSVTYAVLLRPLPWPNADQLVELKETRGGRAPRFGAFSNAAFLAWANRPATVERIAAWSQRTVTLESPADPERVRVTAASADLFPALGVTPLMGSFFESKDELSPVIVLSEGLWRRRFGADAGLIGKPVFLDGGLHTVVGVLSEEFAFPDRQTRAWIPLRVAPAVDNYLSLFSAIGLLRPGATPAQAAAEGTARGRFAADTGMTTMAIFGGSGPVEVSATSLGEALTVEVRRPLLVLLAAAGLLLVVAVANVASLQLARASARRREMAVRAATGADTGRLVRQLLVENLLLGAIGGCAGVILASLIHQAVPALLPAGFPRASEVAMAPVAILFALVLSMATGVAFGVLPAFHLRRLDLVSSLTERATTIAGTGGRLKIAQLRLLIMGGQVAVTCLLLAGASLLGRSFWSLMHTERGYDPAGVVTATLPLPAARYTPERRYELVEQILQRLATTSGVKSAAFTSEFPLTAGGSTAAFSLRSPILDGPTSVQASPRLISAEYFSAMGMRMVAGRAFTASDGPGSKPVAIVNRAFARQYLGEAPLGAEVPMGLGYGVSGTSAAVIGVVDDVRFVEARDASLPELYYTYPQLGRRLVTPVATLVVSTHMAPGMLLSTIQSVIRDTDRSLVADRVATLEDRIATMNARPRLYAILLGAFAAFSLIVAAVGLFGVLSYTVGQRARELAVRAALGAGPASLVRVVLAQALGVAAVGAGVGLLAALALGSPIRALLYGVRPHDPLTFIAVPVVVLVVAAAACAGPARRAARVDPVKELRS